ncbi:site-specific integrase [Nocardia transvalensis]|uniref:site-specific integrase n=1 Tax=Nocardia transvalensis TaxID=37333 RepID=UPI001894F1A0|nr:tyrosine-type recombinase/integrase [Nocardia transvalensis]MBF6333375.1 tyrosine-type recombinase/integrase [Nocardia transvalensis]
MARPPLPIGTWGKISRIPVGPNRWYAYCYVRDHDGVTRRARRWTPRGVKDRNGAAAERRLLEHLRDRTHAGGDEINGETTIEDLWKAYRKYLVEKKKVSHNTLDRYDRAGKAIVNAMRRVRLREGTTQRFDRFLTEYEQHGGSDVKGVRIVLNGMCALAVRYDVWPSNPIRETEPIKTKPAKGAAALEPEQVRQLLLDVRTSSVPCPPLPKMTDGQLVPTNPKYRVPTIAQFCARGDLADPITMFSATGSRASELMAFLLEDYDPKTGIILVTGHVIRVPGVGLIRESNEDNPNNPKNLRRAIQLAPYAVAMLDRRIPTLKPIEDGTTPLFQSAAGTLRDPTNYNDQWRRVRTALGLPDNITGHSFRKFVVDVGLDAKLSAALVADQVGHVNPTETLNTYASRRRRPTGAMANAIQNAVFPSQNIQ